MILVLSGIFIAVVAALRGDLGTLESPGLKDSIHVESKQSDSTTIDLVILTIRKDFFFTE